jgi:effector-binding domain-containing protein/uncharacterized protein YndB with AHSA1/START domain
MKALKIIGIIVAVIGLAVMAFIMTLKGEGHLERSITINAPVEKVFKVVNDFSYAKEWSPWFQIDPDTKYEYSANTVGVGAKYTWDSEDENVGNGEQEIIEVKENELVNTRMAFGGMTGIYYASFILNKNGNNSTELTWTYDGTADAVGEKFFIDYLAESILGGVYEEGVVSLKKYVESLPDYAITIEQVEAKGIPYIGIRVPMPAESELIGAKMGEIYGRLGAFMEKNKIAMAGMPMTVYYVNEDGSIDMECAMPTAELVKSTSGDVVSKVTFTGTLLKGIHLGDYNKLGESHQELMSYLASSNFEQAGDAYEIYITDPTTEQDTAKWQTDIYIPVREKGAK